METPIKAVGVTIKHTVKENSFIWTELIIKGIEKKINSVDKEWKCGLMVLVILAGIEME